MTLSAPVELPGMSQADPQGKKLHQAHRRGLDRQRAGVVRHLLLRLFRRLCLEGVFSEQRSDHFAAADLRHVRIGVPDSPDRRPRARRLCRPPRPQGVADDFHRHDDDRHAGDRLHADLRDHRHPGADRGSDRAPVAGIFGRRRIRQLDRVSGRACAGPPRLHRKLAICQPGAGRDVVVGVRRRADLVDDARRDGRLGLADSVFLRRAGRTGRHLHPQPSGGRDRRRPPRSRIPRSARSSCIRSFA